MKNLDSANKASPKKVALDNTFTANTQLNLLKLKQNAHPRRKLKIILSLIVATIIVLGAGLAFRATNLSQKIFVGQKTTFFSLLSDLIRGGGDSQKLIGEDLGQINILLLGIGGEGHDGPNLTDTMILAQIRPDIGEVALTSIPRDYLVNLPQSGSQDKINSAFAYGLLKHKDWDEAGAWSRKVVENISGLSVPYFAVIDFSGFEKAVNQVGGLDIQIDRTFTDYQYPNSGYGFLPPITFTQGPEHMDGARALIFARSRHAEGLEGSDFARSLRQQKILEAFKQKVFSLNLIKDASTLNQLLSVFASHFHTNIPPGSLYRINNLLKGKNINIFSLSLDPETKLVCPEILASNGAYVLVPCKSEDDVKNYFKNSFAIGKINSEKSIVWLASSTGNNAAFQTAMRKLTNAGLIVFELNYSKDNLPQTVIYQASSKPATAEFIINELRATQVDLPPPGVNVNRNKVDVIVVLGLNAPVEAAPKPYIPPPARVATSTNTSSTPISTSTKSATTTTTSTTKKK
ncbi:MAG: LCP family protein [Patescibacteria group bacterium]|nr:LCP family protein [Patescibacteria group bacterium]